MDRSERRKAVRIVKPVEIEYACECTSIKARTVDLSDQGVFIDTHHPLAVASVLDLWLYLPTGSLEEPVRLRGVVKWAEPRVGVGVSFQELTAADRERLRLFVGAVFFGQEELLPVQ